MTTGASATTADKLKAYVERMETLLDEIDGMKDALKDVKAQARDDGFNVQAMVKLVGIRRNKRHASRETEMLNDLVIYAHATGTPFEFAFAEDGREGRTEPADSGSGPVPPAS